MAVEKIRASALIDTTAVENSVSSSKKKNEGDFSFGSMLMRAQSESLANGYSQTGGKASDGAVTSKQFDATLKKAESFSNDSGRQSGKHLTKLDSKGGIDTGEVQRTIGDAVDKAVTEVKEAIKEELGIDDERLEEVMETLGLTAVDLLKPESIMAIIIEVKGVGLADVLMDEKLASAVMDIMRVQRNVTSDLIEELDISSDEFKAMLQGEPVEVKVPEAKTEDAPKFEISLDKASKDEVKVVVEDKSVSDGKPVELKQTNDTLEPVKAEEIKTDKPLENLAVVSDEDKETIGTNTEIVNSSSEVVKSDRQPKDDREIINDTKEGEEQVNKTEVNTEVVKTETGGEDQKKESDSKGKESGENEAPLPKTEVKSRTSVRTSDISRQIKPEASVSSFQQNMADAIKEAVTDAPQANAAEQLNNAVRAEEIMRQITEQVKIQVKSEATSMELQLNPASLGKVGLHIESKGGVITAQILAQNETVKSAIESQVVTLKEAIEAKGIKIEEVEVTVASHAFEQNLMGDQSSGQNFNSDDRSGAERSARLRRINLGTDGSFGSEETIADDGERLARQMMIENGGSLDLMA